MPKSEGPRPLIAGRRLGQIEEYFIEGLSPGDTFIFAGQMLRFIGVRENDALVVRATGDENPRIPSYAGGKFPLSTFLAERVRRMLHDPAHQTDVAAASARLDRHPAARARSCRSRTRC